ncbi:hypothetical protein KAW18_03705 [candidate division WOR-3 bacterium]|nr:hypothetical protein [Candidatus Parcubacteria bacterium]MCK4526452.1 hypothetical protein [candidate division WOR-3 bacterium]
MLYNYNQIKQVLNGKKEFLFEKKGVVATGIGYKTINNKQTSELSIICSVNKKISTVKLCKKDLIPPVLKGVQTDVVETGIIKSLHTSKHRPAPGGVSVGHIDITAGTLGCVVRKNGVRHILSNNHVLACSNDAEIGDAILQPGTHDSGLFPADHIADLTMFVPINFTGVSSECPIGGAFTKIINSILYAIGRKTRLQAIKQTTGNLVDAAIARPLNDEDVSDKIMEIGKIVGVKSAILGTYIQKSGRTTEFTQGEITQIDVSVNVQYGEGKIAQFNDQIMAGAMSAGGDSGSAILTEDNEICGLLFAGSDTVTVINRIEHVFELLDINL